jgi:hypothetical protein
MARGAAKKGKASATRKVSEETPLPSQRETRRTRRSASVESVELVPASQTTRGSRNRTTRSTSQDPTSKDPKNSLFNIPDPPDVARRRNKRVASRASSLAPTVSDADPDEDIVEEQESELHLKLEAEPEIAITEHSTITASQDVTSFTTTEDTTFTSSAQFAPGSVAYPDISHQMVESTTSSTGLAQSVEDATQNSIYNFDVHELSTVPEESPLGSESTGDVLSQDQLDQHQLDQQVFGDAEMAAEATESYASATSEASSVSDDHDASSGGDADRSIYEDANREVVDLATDEDNDANDYQEYDVDANRYQPEESDQEDFITVRPITNSVFLHDDDLDENSGDDEGDEVDEDEEMSAEFIDDEESADEGLGEASDPDSDLEIVQVNQEPIQIDDSDDDDQAAASSTPIPHFAPATPSIHNTQSGLATQFGRATQPNLASPFVFTTPTTATTQREPATRNSPEVIDLGGDDDEESPSDAKSANPHFAQTAQELPSSSPVVDTHMEDSSSKNSTFLLNNQLKQILQPPSPTSQLDFSVGQVRSNTAGLPFSSPAGQLPSSPFNPEFTSTPRNHTTHKFSPFEPEMESSPNRPSDCKLQKGREMGETPPFQPWSDIDRLYGHVKSEASPSAQLQHELQCAALLKSDQDYPPSLTLSRPLSQSQSQSQPGHESEVDETSQFSLEYKHKYECSIDAYEASLSDNKVRDIPDYSIIPKPMSRAAYGTFIARRMERSAARRALNPNIPIPSIAPTSLLLDPQQDKHEEEISALRKKIAHMEQLHKTHLNRISELEAQNAILAIERDQYAAKADSASRKYWKSQDLPKERDEASEFEERAREVARLREEQQIRKRNFAARANLMAMETSTTAEVSPTTLYNVLLSVLY